MRKCSLFLSVLYFIFLSLQLHAQYGWRLKACLPGTGRNGIANFSIGSKAYVVGGANFSTVLSEVWEYNALTNTWTQKNNFGGGGRGVPSSFVIDSFAYVGLGIDNNRNYYNDFWKYDPATDQWTAIAPFPGSPRYTAMAFAINGKGYVGCGKGANEYNDFYEYDPTSNSWAQIASLPGGLRQTGIGKSIGSFGYCGLGYSNGIYLNDLYKYDPTANIWIQLNSLPFGGLDAVSCFAIDTVLYIASGRNSSSFFTECWAYFPSANSWAQQQDFGCYGPGRSVWEGFTINGHGYTTCGDDNASNYMDLLEFGPPDSTFIEQVHILGNDTSYCGNFSRTLSTGNSCTLWSTGVTASQIVVDSSGTYWAYFPDSCGMASDTIKFNQVIPPVNFGKDTFLCTGQTLVLDAGNPNATYHWQNDSTGQNEIVTESGTYSVTVSTSNCVSVDSIEVNIGAIGPVTITGPTVFCSGDSAAVCAPSGYYSYSWNVGGSGNCIEAKDAGDYYVTVTEVGGCTAESNHLPVSVYPVPSVSIIVEGDTLFTYGAVSYQWFLDGNPINGATTAIYIVRSPGSYTLKVTDTIGCTTISNPVDYTGVSNLTEANITLYPNPSSGDFQLNVTTELLGSQLAIYDVDGRVVYRSDVHELNMEFDPDLAKGIYWVEIYSPDVKIVRKLIKL